MSDFMVNNLWKNCANTVVKTVDDFPPLNKSAGLSAPVWWKKPLFSPNFHASAQAETTAWRAVLTAWWTRFFHYFHKAYYDDYDIFNKKGIA